MKNAFSIVKDFEDAVANYTKAPFVVAVNSCTNALALCLEYFKQNDKVFNVDTIIIPERTYVSVPIQIKRAGFNVRFRPYEWKGEYQLEPLPIWDSARLFTSYMYKEATYQCVSFHWSKTLSTSQGGAILHSNKEADIWFRKMRFDGRTEGIKPKDDNINLLGMHCYLSPEVAAQGLVKLMHLPSKNNPLSNDDYPDLSQMEIFK